MGCGRNSCTYRSFIEAQIGVRCSENHVPIEHGAPVHGRASIVPTALGKSDDFEYARAHLRALNAFLNNSGEGWNKSDPLPTGGAPTISSQHATRGTDRRIGQ